MYDGDIVTMEKIQNRMTRLIMEGSRIRPQERNVRFKLPTHELRRKIGDLIIFINIQVMIRDNSGSDPLSSSDDKR